MLYLQKNVNFHCLLFFIASFTMTCIFNLKKQMTIFYNLKVLQ